MDVSLALGFAGCAAAVGLAALGSAIGCAIGGSASHGAMAKVEEGHGKYIGMSAAPSSQTIYGIVLMFVLFDKVNAEAGIGLLGIGVFCGLAMLVSAWFQGTVIASAIQASTKKPELFGKCFAAVGIVESFALFALVGGLIIVGMIGT